MEPQPSPTKPLGDIGKTANCSSAGAPPRAVDGDFYKILHLVDAADQALLGRVRAFAEQKVAPIINQTGGRVDFPLASSANTARLGSAARRKAGLTVLAWARFSTVSS